MTTRREKHSRLRRLLKLYIQETGVAGWQISHEANLNTDAFRQFLNGSRPLPLQQGMRLLAWLLDDETATELKAKPVAPPGAVVVPPKRQGPKRIHKRRPEPLSTRMRELVTVTTNKGAGSGGRGNLVDGKHE